ncbi:MAG: hypothetical protein QXG05_08055 [Nitrososphaerota archaeon]
MSLNNEFVFITIDRKGNPALFKLVGKPDPSPDNGYILIPELSDSGIPLLMVIDSKQNYYYFPSKIRLDEVVRRLNLARVDVKKVTMHFEFASFKRDMQ